jgi:hypothetical protein
MSYRLRWKRSALEELADLWTDADSSDRREINQALSSIEHELARTPLQAGESRPAGNRIVLEPPIAVVFNVDPDKQQVRVLQIWRY